MAFSPLKTGNIYIWNGIERPDSYVKVISIPAIDYIRKELQVVLGVYETKAVSILAKTDLSIYPLQIVNIRIYDNVEDEQNPILMYSTYFNESVLKEEGNSIRNQVYKCLRNFNVSVGWFDVQQWEDDV